MWEINTDMKKITEELEILDRVETMAKRELIRPCMEWLKYGLRIGDFGNAIKE